MDWLLSLLAFLKPASMMPVAIALLAAGAGAVALCVSGKRRMNMPSENS